MTSYAASVNIRHISTGRPPKGKEARAMLTLPAATAKALDSLRYITRADAAADLDIIGHSQGETMIAEDATDRRAMMEMSRWAIDARAARHTEANGVRLADKLIVSLPADASPEHHREMVAGILADLGGDSDAWMVGAIHRDRAGNPHAHILAIDGLETRAAAQARRPNAQRVRRRDQLRLNEGGNRPKLRARIAAHINAISAREGYRLAEIRNLADQGITRPAQEHEGPHGSARRRSRDLEDWLSAGITKEPGRNWLDTLAAAPDRDRETSLPGTLTISSQHGPTEAPGAPLGHQEASPPPAPPSPSDPWRLRSEGGQAAQDEMSAAFVQRRAAADRIAREHPLASYKHRHMPDTR